MGEIIEVISIVMGSNGITNSAFLYIFQPIAYLKNCEVIPFRAKLYQYRARVMFCSLLSNNSTPAAIVAQSHATTSARRFCP
jgi:hypothetical protein